MATTGDCNITGSFLKKYIGNKLCFSDPVDGATGSLYIPSTDMILPDIHDEFKIERKYESVNPMTGMLGKNWTVNVETYIEINGDNASVLCTDGHVESFNKVNNLWINDKGGAKIYTLKEENNFYIFKSQIDKRIYTYDNLGKLLKVVDIYGNELNITYVENHIETLTTFSNYKLFFTYKDNKVIQIKDELGRCVQYKYDHDYLTQVVHVDQGITRYNYDEHGYITNVTDQNGHTYIKNVFDEKGRVIRQDYPDGDFAEVKYDESEKENTFYYHNSVAVNKNSSKKGKKIPHLRVKKFTQD